MNIEPRVSKPSKRRFDHVFSIYLSLPILSWALYDFANTIFSSNITTIFFPFYLQEAIGNNARMEQIASTFISYANALASFFLVIFSPLFGVMIDKSSQRKKPLFIFTMITVGCTIAMGLFSFMSSEQTIAGLPITLIIIISLFVVAKFFYHSSLIFYDSMMSDLGTREHLPLISGFGVAVGYVGTLVGLTIYPFIKEPNFHHAFIPTGIMFFVFSLPLFLFVKEKKQQPQLNTKKPSFVSGYLEIYQTFREMKLYKPIFTFMIVYFFINDAIATTIAMMAIYAKVVVGFTTSMFILLYLVSTVTSIIGSFIFGYITKKIGAKRAITLVAIILIMALVMAVGAISSWMFWISGSLFGVALGAMWVTTRTLIIELTPPERRGQFFGLFAFSGKVSAIIGPLLYGTITLLFANLGSIASRMALGSLLVLAVIGLVIHLRASYEVTNRS
ncbi:MFS transporter [Metabacillus iocasae]|uniref:UMF1 family MFS transporter n=1 Tax=Priestia iocasae TaxID=2291674 RepID=A0ABS2QYX0_9BACI|nr:MFS transporter [Metabacillus iocasae]MBM7704684.1 UMF1 family MFS transporter [Metabacillus iocasae]